MKIKFYKCSICGKVIGILTDSGTPTFCCGKEMMELIPGTTDGALEKHVPVISTHKNMIEVNVGAAAHPMMDTHYIEWIALKTKDGMQFKKLKPGQEPKAVFTVNKDELVEKAYAYCNIHDLWSSN